MPTSPRTHAIALLLFGGLSLLAFSGCQTTQVSEPEAEIYHFFPSPPAEPRFQFLVSFSEEKDLDGDSKEGFARFVLGEEPPRNSINKPYGIAIHDGAIYVCDTVSNTIEEVDLKQSEIRYFSPKGQGALRKPINIVVDDDGTRYVTDTIRGQVLIYNASGGFLQAIGKSGELKPSDVLVSEDRIYMTDLNSHSVLVYDKASREPLFTIPRENDDENAQLFLPIALAMDQVGGLYVSDSGAFQIKHYDAEGKYVKSVGRQGDRMGEFSRPKGIATDRENRLYVVDAATQVMQIFDDAGQLLLFFGEPGAAEINFVLPAQVIVDYDHLDYFRKYASPDFELEYLVIVTNQYGARKVSVFGFGQMKEP